MNTRRALLYSGYGLLRSMGYFTVRDKVAPYATILTFHRVNAEDEDPLTLHPRVFEELLGVLIREYRIMSMTNLMTALKIGERFEPKTVVVTFDDGYLDNYSIAAPLLKRFRIPATFFVTTGYVGTQRQFPWDATNPIRHRMMTWDHVRQLALEGFDIGAHSVNHLNLGKCSPEVASAEICDSKRHLEDRLGKEVAGFAYPFGGVDCMNEMTMQVTKSAGFLYSCSNYGGKVTSTAYCQNIQRTGVYPTATETLMEIDNFMTYHNGTMRMHFLGTTISVGSCRKPGEGY